MKAMCRLLSGAIPGRGRLEKTDRSSTDAHQRADTVNLPG